MTFQTFPGLALLACLPLLHGGTLYTTDFENFTAGPNNWAGTDGWLSSDTTSGAQAIDSDIVPGGGLGQTASLGYNQPNSVFTSVARFFNHDHTTGLPGIGIRCLLGIEDSTNNHRDDFYLTIYNAAGSPLAAIRFDNDNPDAAGSQFGIWREDGVNQFDTLVDFSPGQLYDLYIEIDLPDNTWSADIGGFPLFVDAPFTNNATGADINFGVLAYEWGLTAQGPSGYGDNFLLLADLTVRSYPIGVEPFTVDGTRDASTGSVTLSWHGEPGFDYQVQFSHDLENWHDTLPGSSFPGITTEGPLSYTDTSAALDLYYCVVRSESP